ncbi:LiaF transmembrane domain-containing protein [Aminicella lysinilytica]|jgi:predicted membrane protein|uniref:LiaF transmembrane domain-containing protein n=2 Tax=Aminicella lysinilytica TaxID=433323 RepID=A0A4R6PZ38_9FIRM|nr:hypothetical protein [Aminicella lysinilytica]TDP52994.1 hypothetical protein EV211_12412 [Aminicella lysinilytica]
MKKNSIFWGIMLLLAAAFLIIGKLGYLGGISAWSIIFTIFLAVIMIKSIRPLNYWGILFPIAFLCIIYDGQLGIETLTPWTVLIVAFLGSCGLSLIFPPKKWHKSSHDDEPFDFSEIDFDDDSNVRQNTRFGATVKYINSADLKTVDLVCHFGGVKVYFDKAQIQTSAVVHLDVSFGGVEMYVPREWKVENHTSVSLGAVEEKGMGAVATADSPMLKLVGTVSLSGVEIIYI